MEIQLKTLTPIWTGGVDGKMVRIHETGIIGSLRWWYEVVIRGLDGFACDPSDTKCEGQNRCVACELFGCTSWGRKFRFQVLDNNGKPFSQESKADDEYIFRFTPLRKIEDEEWALLDLTVRLIAEYGAMGGKTVLKPSKEENREHKNHHQDYGLIAVISSDLSEYSKNQNLLKKYFRNTRWKSIDHNDFAWASLKNFWCVRGNYLARQNGNDSTFNKVIGRPEPKSQSSNHNSWLSGEQMVSKKVFSFKKNPRTFGFVKEDVISFDEMKKSLKLAWSDLKDNEFLYGDEIINRLFINEEKSS